MNTDKNAVIKIEFYDGLNGKMTLLPTSQLRELEDKLFTYALVSALEKELFEQTQLIA
jgi:hypothetical protein